MSRGDVCWVELADDKRRPAVILTRDAAIPVLKRIIIAPTSRNARGIATEVSLDKDDGMPAECVISLDNLRLVEHRKVGGTITSLSGAKMHEVCRALAIATGCS